MPPCQSHLRFPVYYVAYMCIIVPCFISDMFYCIGMVHRTKVALSCGGETFHASGSQPVSPGFTAVMPWLVRRCKRHLHGADEFLMQMKTLTHCRRMTPTEGFMKCGPSVSDSFEKP